MAVNENFQNILVITEQWIREKLGLHDNALDTVRSLALPGTYHQKITHLGRSLLCFSRLRHLDLSRNALESLEGLDHLKLLETLNLYYNCVPDLKELFRLRHNSKLKEMDLRLNPVTREEPDYRLFLVHMLINLRKLDDRLVTEGERKAALMHFDTDQAHEFEPSMKESPMSLKTTRSRQSITKRTGARKVLVNSLAPKSSGLGSDTEELLELMAKKGNTQLLLPAGTAVKALLTEEGQQARNDGCGHRSAKKAKRLSTQITESPSLTRKPPGKQFTDELEAYTVCQPSVHFTPHPGAVKQQPARQECEKEEEEEEKSNTDNNLLEAAITQLIDIMKRNSADGEHTIKDSVARWLQKFVVDRSGEPTPSSTLLLLQAQLSARETEVQALQREIHAQASELVELRAHQESFKESERLLQRTHDDMTALHQHCQALLQENRALRQTMAESSTGVVERERGEESKVTETLLTQLITDTSQVKHQQHLLVEEIHQLIQRCSKQLTSWASVQELATMLQQSHQTIMATNARLAHELKEEQQRHHLEMIQLKTDK